MEKWPKYGLNITKPGKGSIVLRLKDKVDISKATHHSYLNLQAVEGKLIRGPAKTNHLVCMGPRNEVSQAVEVDFSYSYSFPYKFYSLWVTWSTYQREIGKYSMSIEPKTSMPESRSSIEMKLLEERERSNLRDREEANKNRKVLVFAGSVDTKSLSFMLICG